MKYKTETAPLEKHVAKQNLAEYRVNARLDPHRAAKLEMLSESQGVSVSTVLRLAVDCYFEHAHGAKAASSTLDSLVGIGSGPADLSSRYKEYLFESLSKKHGLD